MFGTILNWGSRVPVSDDLSDTNSRNTPSKYTESVFWPGTLWSTSRYRQQRQVCTVKSLHSWWVQNRNPAAGITYLVLVEKEEFSLMEALETQGIRKWALAKGGLYAYLSLSKGGSLPWAEFQEERSKNLPEAFLPAQCSQLSMTPTVCFSARNRQIPWYQHQEIIRSLINCLSF